MVKKIKNGGENKNKYFTKDWIVRFINYDTLFDGIRNEPEFQNILTDMNNIYKAEHERVRKWLEEQVILQF